jgi:hypothetical protein
VSIAPKPSGQALRVCSCGLICYPYEGIKIISVKRCMIYETENTIMNSFVPWRRKSNED